MATRFLRYDSDPILRKKCKAVLKVDDKIRQLLDDMLDTLHETENGAALAANQVGVLKRLVVIDFNDTRLKLVNPQMISQSGMQECVEGCLSFPNRFVKTIRPQKVMIQALNEYGEEIIVDGEDEMAKCFCHELEHHYHAFQEPCGEGEKVILQKGDIMQYSKEESKAIWNQNAEFWDCAMGDESNDFHREVVRPKVTELLNPDPTDYILDIACGNGNYSAYLAEKAVSVLAFDYSEKMMELAKKRQKRYADHIEFCVADATNETSLMALKRNKPFTKAVSNMAIMDITNIKPLFTSVYKLLEDNGVFVFATQHPCFVTLTEKYMTPHSYYDIAIEGQPQKQCYYHRSLQDIFNLCFDTGFVIDGFYEECYFNKEIPDIIIVRAIKIER